MSKMLRAFEEITPQVPFWYMRQAGRYLPEYRAVREKAGDFLDLCYSPSFATEVTLQPHARFDMSAAIIFSDILVVPHALGIAVRFEKGEGPAMPPLTPSDALLSFDKQRFEKHLAPVYAALQQTRAALPAHKTLIGFCGAAWTVLCYMLQGKGGKEFAVAREWVFRDETFVMQVLATLEEAIAAHAIAQLRAGAEMIQLFDSWAGLVPEGYEEKLIFAPTQRIVQRIKAAFPSAPIIGFARGFGHLLGEYARETSVQGVGVDVFTRMEDAVKRVPQDVLLQGNLDPLLLAANKEATLQKAQAILSATKGRKFIFNLGHGMLPHTPIAHVEALSQYLQEARRV
jgi:uroporphyrinogen decarboxylase